MSEGRLVWITREQRDATWQGKAGLRQAVLDAYDAAPADPAEAVRLALIDNGYDFDGTLDSDMLAVLAALGVPRE